MSSRAAQTARDPSVAPVGHASPLSRSTEIGVTKDVSAGSHDTRSLARSLAVCPARDDNLFVPDPGKDDGALSIIGDALDRARVQRRPALTFDDLALALGLKE